jgi:hypothetical protein
VFEKAVIAEVVHVFLAFYVEPTNALSCSHRITPLVSAPNLVCLVDILTSCFLLIFILILLSCVQLSCIGCVHIVRPKLVCAVTSCHGAYMPTHLTLDFITLTVLSRDYESSSSPSWIFLQPPITACACGTNILVSVLFPVRSCRDSSFAPI